MTTIFCWWIGAPLLLYHGNLYYSVFFSIFFLVCVFFFLLFSMGKRQSVHTKVFIGIAFAFAFALCLSTPFDRNTGIYTYRYWNSVQNVPRVGRYLARFIKFLYENGVSMQRVHIIGFSLGAEVAGFAGKTLKEWNLKLVRITGTVMCHDSWLLQSL